MVGVFDTEGGDQNFFHFVRGGTRFFFTFVRKGPVFYHSQRGGPEKISDCSSQIDAPLLVKNDTSLTDIVVTSKPAK